MKLFEIIDKSRRKIYLSKERWGHIVAEHPVVADKIEEIKDTLVNPLTIRESKYDPKVRFYYKYDKNVKLKEKYLMVVVKHKKSIDFLVPKSKAF